tara:strand:- start:565 stop:714 length:150 start_codon:yes stop_codon:yes gene_type:complete
MTRMAGNRMLKSNNLYCKGESLLNAGSVLPFNAQPEELALHKQIARKQA